ncbi:MAG: hydrolase 1, exosortase A system-associated [Emcibacter sp.]|nr:hydrolase 1, exosortase A system-associated [Emcibacter sp.]
MNRDDIVLTETAFTFTNDAQKQLIGIIHSPTASQVDSSHKENHLNSKQDSTKKTAGQNPEQDHGKVGLLIIVGGPQYRIGSHRQYVHLARHCAARGIPVMRFDYQGIGDSDGIYPGFEHTRGDIHCAIDVFLDRTPDIDTVAIWGLCEGASGILLGGAEHKAISHIILANSWVRSEAGLAKAYVKHYYIDRLKSPEFWRKIFSGHLNIKAAISGFLANIKQAFAPKKSALEEKLPKKDQRSFQERMCAGLNDFHGKILLIMSGNDLVAREFDDLITTDKAWKKVIREKSPSRLDIPDTDHTFSTSKWRDQVAKGTADWLLSAQ